MGVTTKRRVHQVAKEFNISNEALIGFLTDLDFQIRGPMTALSEEMYEHVSKKYKKDQVSKDPDQEFRKQIREKKLKEEKARERARQELEERMLVATRFMETRSRQKSAGDEDGVDGTVDEAKAPAQPVDGKAKRKVVSRVKGKKADNESKPGTKAAPTLEESIVSLIPEEDLHPAARVEPPAEEGDGKAAEVKAKTPEDKKDGAEKTSEAPKKRRRRRRRKKRTAEENRVSHTEDGQQDTTTPEVQKEASKPKKKSKKRKKRKISEEEIEESIRQTLAAMESGGKPRTKRRRVRDEAVDEIEDEKNRICVTEYISVADLAKRLDVEPAEVIQQCLSLGMIVSINQRLDADTIQMVGDEFGYEVEIVQEYGTELVDAQIEEDDDPSLSQSRSPVVTIMGHVDHGKTSLLDYIRESTITAGESGGITQHIGAYEVDFNNKLITFLDTPGHEAFTAMRARGAQATDIVILVVAADDGVQQQTIEAISHARAASVPIVVAVNKIDKPNANPENIKQQLSQHGILVESWGGKYQSAEISAKTGKGIDQLLELVLLEAEILDLKANPDRLARGVVVEAELDKGKGPVATVLVQNGTLRVGDPFIAGQHFGKVRAMYDEHGRRVKEAPPAKPVQVVGFSGVSSAGDTLAVMKNEQEAKEIAMKRQQLRRVQESKRTQHITLDQFSQRVKEGELKELMVIVKGDVEGSVEALSDALLKLSTDEVAVRVIHKAVGGISESDVFLAAASNAVIFGFQVRATIQAKHTAERENVDIRIYQIIYDAVNEVKAALEGMLDPELTEENTSSIEVRQVFKVPRVGTVAGCYVQSGKAYRNDHLRLYRNDALVYEGKIGSLKRFKEDVREVASGFECGIKIEGYDDIHVDDIIETYKVVETKRTLASVAA